MDINNRNERANNFKNHPVHPSQEALPPRNSPSSILPSFSSLVHSSMQPNSRRSHNPKENFGLGIRQQQLMEQGPPEMHYTSRPIATQSALHHQVRSGSDVRSKNSNLSRWTSEYHSETKNELRRPASMRHGMPMRTQEARVPYQHHREFIESPYSAANDNGIVQYDDSFHQEQPPHQPREERQDPHFHSRLLPRERETQLSERNRSNIKRAHSEVSSSENLSTSGHGDEESERSAMKRPSVSARPKIAAASGSVSSNAVSNSIAGPSSPLTTRTMQSIDSSNSNTRPGKLRQGRWPEEEVLLAIKLTQMLLSGELRTKKRMYLREVLRDELKTGALRVFKRFKGHAVLKFVTYTVNMQISKHDQIALRECELPFSISLLTAAKCHFSLQELRHKFAEATT